MNAIHTMWKDAAKIATWPAAHTLNRLLVLCMLLFAASLQTAGAAAPQLNSLKNINFAGLPGNQVQITFELSQPVSNPASFTIDNPAIHRHRPRQERHGCRSQGPHSRGTQPV